MLALLSPAMVPIPIRTVRRALSEVLLMTPGDLDAEVRRVMDAAVTRHGFSGHSSHTDDVPAARTDAPRRWSGPSTVRSR